MGRLLEVLVTGKAQDSATKNGTDFEEVGVQTLSQIRGSDPGSQLSNFEVAFYALLLTIGGTNGTF